MLVLSRKPSQQVIIGSDVSITIVRIDRNHVRIGITAPPGVQILRKSWSPKTRSGAASRTQSLILPKPRWCDWRDVWPRARSANRAQNGGAGSEGTPGIGAMTVIIWSLTTSE